MRRRMMAGLLCLCTTLMSCNSKELTRSRAMTLIEGSEAYTRGQAKIPLTIADANELVKSKLLRWDGGLSAGFERVGTNFRLEITDTGKQYFGSTEGRFVILASIEADGTLIGDPKEMARPMVGPIYIVPIHPIKAKLIEVTGISDNSEGEKRVEYTWQWDGGAQPSALRSAMQMDKPHQESVIVKLYDDGWRIEPQKQKELDPPF